MNNDSNDSGNFRSSSNAASSRHNAAGEITTIELTPEQAQAATSGRITIQPRESGSFRASDLVPQRQGILATAHKPNGDLAFDLTPDVLVKVGNVPMRLRDAERFGYVKRDEKGNYVDASAELQQSQEQQQQQQDAEQKKAEEFPVAMSEEGAAFLNDLHGALHAIGADPRVAVMDFMRDPGMWRQKYAERLAKFGGSSPEDVWADVRETASEVIGQVEALAKAEGVDPDEFRAFLDTKPSETRAAILDALDGNALMLRRMVGLFKTARPNYRRPTAGMKTRKTQDGTEYVKVRLPTGREIEVSVANARQLGWLK